MGRVEEVPASTREGSGGGGGGAILTRRLVRIYTPGTSADILELCSGEASAPVWGEADGGPVMALVEATVAAGTGNNSSGGTTGGGGGVVYGWAALDVGSGALRMGQMYDNGGRGALLTLLLHMSPAEVVSACGGLSPATQAAVRRQVWVGGHQSVAAGVGKGPRDDWRDSGGGDCSVVSRRAGGVLWQLPASCFPTTSSSSFQPARFTTLLPDVTAGLHSNRLSAASRLHAVAASGINAAAAAAAAAAVAHCERLLITATCGDQGTGDSGAHLGVLGSVVRPPCDGGNTTEVGPAALLRTLRQAVAGTTGDMGAVGGSSSCSGGCGVDGCGGHHQVLAVHAAAVLLAHLTRCSVLPRLLSCLQPSLDTPCSSMSTMHPTAGMPSHPHPHPHPSPAAAVQPPAVHAPRHMSLDHAAITTLELLQGSLGGPEGSLRAFLDKTAWQPSSRKLRAWITR